MAMMVETLEQTDTAFKVEGDLGDLQIIEELSTSEDEDGTQIEPCKANTVANIPGNLMQPGTAPVFGTVAVTNSENVQFGNNTFFNGPVTIKQVIQSSSGIDNASYAKTENEDPITKFKSKEEPSYTGKFQIKLWHKLSLIAVGILVLGSVCAIILITLQSDQTPNSRNGQSNGEDGSNHSLVMELRYWNVQMVISLVFLIPITYIIWVFWWKLTWEAACCEPYNLNETPSTSTLSLNNRYNADNLLIAASHLRIVSRTDWLAQPVEEKIDDIRQPVPWVIITHTATEGCFSQSACVLNVRLIQTFHIESRRWSDIGYNFLVGGDGSAYYGRGWDQIGAHTKGYNKYSIGIAFIGTFNTESPTQNQVDACRKLIELGVAQGKLAKDYKLFAHRQLLSSLSPGDKVFDIISKWPHFVKETNITSLLPNY